MDLGWILGTTGLTLRTHWVPSGYVGAAGVILGTFRLHFGRTCELLDSILRSLVVTLDALGSKMDAAIDQVDGAKTYEDCCSLVVLGGWRVILEAWRSSWLRCWHT